MITIDAYTGTWNSALRPVAPRAGSLVRIAEEADAREYYDFRNCCSRAGMETDFQACFVRWLPRLRMNVYRIRRSK